MSSINVIVIICILVTKRCIVCEKNENRYDVYFENVEFPKSDAIPMLNRKVFRGMRVSINEHPYVVSIRRLYSHYMTGTLLTKNLVITVAHPLYRVNPSQLGVVVGENYSDRGTAMLSVVLIIIHEDFDLSSLKDDLALVRLYEDIIYKVSVKPISLISPHFPTDGATAFVTGWGRCDKTGRELCLPRTSKYLQGERLDPMLRAIKFTMERHNLGCRSYPEISEGMLCTGTARVDEFLCPCMAVPGAPLVINSRLAGLQSWGFGCGYTHDLPLIYTDIKEYLDWLVYNVPILKTVKMTNLTYIFEATKVYTLSQWLVKTRLNKPLLKQFPMREIQSLTIDAVLSKIRGKVYDVRDFVDDGRYHHLKKGLYNSIQASHKKGHLLKEVGRTRKLDVKPFLSIDTLGDSGIAVRNGSLYFDDTMSTTKSYDEELDDSNQINYDSTADVPDSV